MRLIVLAIAVAFCGAVDAQEYPAQPVRIVTSSVGGTTDVVARLIAQGLIKDVLFRDGTEVIGSSPQEFAAAIRAELATLGKMIKAAGIRTE